MSHKDTGFADRLAYVRWLRNRGAVVAENDRVFAESAGVGYEWLLKWKKRMDAPTDRIIAKALCDFLGVAEGWLFDGEGSAPEPKLWDVWQVMLAHRRASAAAPKQRKRGA